MLSCIGRICGLTIRECESSVLVVQRGGNIFRFLRLSVGYFEESCARSFGYKQVNHTFGADSALNHRNILEKMPRTKRSRKSAEEKEGEEMKVVLKKPRKTTKCSRVKEQPKREVMVKRKSRVEKKSANVKKLKIDSKEGVASGSSGSKIKSQKQARARNSSVEAGETGAASKTIKVMTWNVAGIRAWVKVCYLNLFIKFFNFCSPEMGLVSLFFMKWR